MTSVVSRSMTAKPEKTGTARPAVIGPAKQKSSALDEPVRAERLQPVHLSALFPPWWEVTQLRVRLVIAAVGIPLAFLLWSPAFGLLVQH